MANVLLKISFEDEGHLDASLWIYILTIHHEFLLFQFFTRDMRMYIAILTEVQNERISCQKNRHILLKNVLFEAYFPR